MSTNKTAKFLRQLVYNIHMDDFRTKKKVKRLVILVGISLVVIGVLVFVLSLLTSPKLVTPVPETDNVRIIFVTPEPKSSELQIESSASPSATTKSESKINPTPKATSKPTPIVTSKPTPKATASAEVNE